MDDALDVWSEAGVGIEASAAEIKRAYAALIKRYRPDSHPAEFSVARQGYERALATARMREIDALRARASANAPTASAEPAPREIASGDEPGRIQYTSAAQAPVGVARERLPERVIESVPTGIGVDRAPRMRPEDAADSLCQHLFDESPEQFRQRFVTVLGQVRRGTLDDFSAFEERLTRRILAAPYGDPLVIVLACDAFGWRVRAVEVGQDITRVLVDIATLSSDRLAIALHWTRLVSGLVHEVAGPRFFLFAPHLDRARAVVKELQERCARRPWIDASRVLRAAGVDALDAISLRSTDVLLTLTLLVLAFSIGDPARVPLRLLAFSAATLLGPVLMRALFYRALGRRAAAQLKAVPMKLLCGALFGVDLVLCVILAAFEKAQPGVLGVVMSLLSASVGMFIWCMLAWLERNTWELFTSRKRRAGEERLGMLEDARTGLREGGRVVDRVWANSKREPSRLFGSKPGFRPVEFWAGSVAIALLACSALFNLMPGSDRDTTPIALPFDGEKATAASDVPKGCHYLPGYAPPLIYRMHRVQHVDTLFRIGQDGLPLDAHVVSSSDLNLNGAALASVKSLKCDGAAGTLIFWNQTFGNDPQP